MRPKLEHPEGNLQQLGFCTGRLLLPLLLALFNVMAAVSPVSADTCSLADHIRSANTNTSIGGCPQGTSHDIITLTEDITLSEALPPIRGTITFEGNGHSISGADKFRIFDVGSGGRLTVKNLTLSNGNWNGQGGAIRLRNGGTLTVENSTFKDNWGHQGGVIAMVSGDVAATISGSSFVGNESELQGGVFLLHGGTATISNSSFVDNNAENAWGGVFHAQGSRLSVTNSTFKGNAGLAGGVLAIMSGRANLTHVTIIDNKSYYLGGDAFYRYGGSIVLRNSLVSNRGPINDCDRGLNVSEGNLSKDGTCSALPIRDLKVGQLTGRPAYFPLQDGSPALDAANADYCTASDQIGTARPADKCDVGAIESTTAELAPTPIVPPPPCPLFDQIIAANTDAPSGGCEAGEGHDIIKLTEDISLNALLPSITSEITIEGNGHTISGSSNFRIFSVDGGALTINNLTLTKGRVAANAKGGALTVQNGGRAIIKRFQIYRQHRQRRRRNLAINLQFPRDDQQQQFRRQSSAGPRGWRRDRYECGPGCHQQQQFCRELRRCHWRRHLNLEHRRGSRPKQHIQRQSCGQRRRYLFRRPRR